MDKHRASNASEQFIKNQLRKIARQLTGVEKRISIVERSSQGKFRSVTDGSTVYYDADGEVRQIVGAQEDGTYTTVDVNAPPLLSPSSPILEAREGTLTITWDGKTNIGSSIWPNDFSHVEIHVSTEDDFITSDATEIASFHARAGGSTTQALEPDTEYFVKFIAINTSGVESPASVEVSATVLAFSTGVQIYYENEMPLGLGLDDEGALWIDTNDDNRQYYWDGTQWIDIQPTAIDEAVNAAADALDLANTKVRVYSQNIPPTGLTADDSNDIWIDTNDGNSAYRYVHGSSAGIDGLGGSGPWLSILDESLASIQYVDDQVILSADGKNKITYSISVPGTTANTAGDTWFRLSGTNVIGQWTGNGGTSWTSVVLDNQVIGSLDAAKITTGFLDVANRIQAGSLVIGQVNNLQTSLDGKTKTFAQTSVPTSTAAGDLWVDTDDSNKLYRAFASGVSTIGGAAWVLVNDPTAKTTTFAQDSIPVSLAVGDIWIDTDDNNKMYRAASIGADAITAGEWIFVTPASTGTKTFAQTAIPISVNIGDLWIDTDDSNKMYVAKSAGADAIVAGEWELFNDLTAKTKTFAQTNIPTSTTAGDLWVDTDDSNKIYRAFASGVSSIGAAAWVLISDPTVKTTTFAQASIPTSTAAGDIWIDTDDSNKLYRAFAASVNTVGAAAWVLINDPTSKTTTFAQTSIPIALAIGDLWIDTDDSNKMYRAGSVGADAITAGEWVLIANPNAATKTFAQNAIPIALSIGDLWIDTDDSNKIYVARSVGADAIVAGEWELFSDLTAKTKTFAQTSVPTSTAAGDLWVDTDDANKIYRAFAAGVSTIGGAAWVLINDPTLKTTTFAQTAIPTSGAAGDLWIDTDDSNKLYRAFAAGVSTIGGAAWVLVDDPTAKTTTFAQTSIPVALAAGDIWIDTDDSNKMYRATVIGSDQITAGEWVLINNPATATKTFAQNAIPVSLSIGDIWVDTDDSNKMYVAKSVGADAITAGEWELFNDLTSKTKTFAQTSIPTAVTAGDLWVDTDDNNKLYRAFAAGVNTIGSSAWVLIQDAVGQVAALQTLWGHPADTTFIDGGDIYTDSVKAQSIILADFLNYVHNPAFDVGTVGSIAPEWTVAVKRLNISAGVPSGAPYATVGHQTTADNYNSTYFEVTPGDSYQVEWYGATSDSTRTFGVGLQFMQADKTTLVSAVTAQPQQTPTSEWTVTKGVVVVPSNAKWARAYTQISGVAPFGNWYFTGLKIRRRAGGELIVDGAIKSTHVVTEGLDASVIKFGIMSGERIESQTITTDKLDSRAIDGMTITGALFRTAEPPNARIEITTEGLLQHDAVNTLVTRIGGDQNFFSGSIDADDILVRDGLLLYGQNNSFGPNSTVTLRTGQGGSNTPPGVNTTYKVRTISPGLTQGFRPLRSYHLGGGGAESGTANFFEESKMYAPGGKTYDLHQIKITQSNGSLAPRIKPYVSTRVMASTGERHVVLGEMRNDGNNDGAYPYIGFSVFDDSVMNNLGTIPPAQHQSLFLYSFSFFRSYAIGRVFDDSNPNAKALFAYSSLDYTVPAGGFLDNLDLKVIDVQGDSSLGTFTAIVNFPFSPHRISADEKVIGVNYGKASKMHIYTPGGSNPADQLVWVVHTTHQNMILSSDGSDRLEEFEWPVLPGTNYKVYAHGDIATNEFTEFVHLTSSNNHDQPTAVLNRYSNWSWNGSPALHYFSFAWRGHSSKVAPEWITTPSPQSSIFPVKRSWLTISIPALPPPEAGLGSARDINKDVYGWIPYAGTNPAIGSMWRQTALTPSGDPTTSNSVDINSNIASSGTNPLSATQGFPSLSPAKLVSSANVGGVPLFSLDGDGNIIAKDTVTGTGKVTGKFILEDRTELKHISTPSNPPSGYIAGPYAKSDTELYLKTNAGAERRIPSSRRDVTDLSIAAASGWTSSTKLTRRGDVVDLYIQVTSVGATAAGAETLVIPTEHFGAGSVLNRYFAGADAGSGTAVMVYWDGQNFRHIFGRSAGQTTFAHITYLAIA